MVIHGPGVDEPTEYVRLMVIAARRSIAAHRKPVPPRVVFLAPNPAGIWMQTWR